MVDFLEELLINQYGSTLANEIINNYSFNKYTTFRVNTLKSSIDEVTSILNKESINYEVLNNFDNAFIIKDDYDIKQSDIFKNGYIYLQSLSSMLPILFLDPKEQEDILDMCAAPGSKTTQICSIVNNNANVTACEVNKVRASRLDYNLKLQNAKAFVIKDSALNLDDFFRFDNILLDAPCSGSGTFTNGVIPKSFTLELVKNSNSLQTKLLNKALKMLKKGQTMVYSTCSILDIENEQVINNTLKKYKCEIVSLDYNKYDYLEALPSKINGALVVKPNKYYEGFFVCKIKKLD